MSAEGRGERKMSVSTWLVHAGREPGSEVLAAMQEWWSEARGPDSDLTTDPGADACVWKLGPLHTLAHLHIDRAAHKRRRRVVYISHNTCDRTDGDHGLTAMSSIVPEDPYGAEPMNVEHSAPRSALRYAFDRVAQDPNLLAITMMTEREFADPEFYHEHASSHLRPLKGGVVLPFLMVPPAKDLLADKEASAEREDILRAHGFSSYSIDIDLTSSEPDQHRDLAMLVEDVCDEIAGIKADAAARVLSYDPRWPMIVIRSAPTWEHARQRVIDGAVVSA